MKGDGDAVQQSLLAARTLSFTWQLGSCLLQMEILSSVEWNKQLFLSDLMSDTAGEREPHALIDEDSFGESNRQ